MPNVCVIDIGGTHFRCGVYQEGCLELNLLPKSDTPNFTTHALDSIQSALVERIISAYAEQVTRFGDLPVLAIGFPGPVTAEGIVLQSSVVFGVDLKEPFDLRGELGRRFKDLPYHPRRLLVTNDMTASAWRYSASGHDPFCLITVSSGIGNKIFAHGRVMIGADGLTGEIGHYEADIGDIPVLCSCGKGSNHVGMISSGRGVEYFARLFAARGGRFEGLFRSSEWGESIGYDPAKIENKPMAKAADAGDPFARSVIDFCTVPLARAISVLALAMYLKRFILIGGFARHCSYYRAALIENVIRKRIYTSTADQIREMIIDGEHDDDHTLIGLGMMALGRTKP